MKSLIAEIKKKKELSDIPDNLIEESLKDYLKKNNLKIPENKKLRKIVIKEIRSYLRRQVGQYQVKTSFKKRLKLLEEDKMSELLKTHSSTKERLDFYPKLKEIIYSYKPQSILDLGCGLNPIVLSKKDVFYYAYDIKESELELIKLYFKKNKIQGSVFLKDITKVYNFPHTDICLVLKVFDILESKQKAKEIIKKINSQIIIASFSSVTLSGKPMNFPRRFWFEEFLEKSGCKFKTLSSSNEIFYIIEKVSRQSQPETQ